MNKTSLCKVIFVCSLVLNGFLIGFLVSNHGLPPHSFKRVDRMEKSVEHLSPAYRAKVEAILAGNRAKIDNHMKSMGDNMDKITAVLTAPKFDATKLKAVHKDIAKSDNGMKDSMLATVTAIAKILPDAERIKFFHDSAPDHPKGPGDHGPGDRGPGEHGPDDGGPPPPDRE
ncbi:MAG: hypothetical protein JWO78_2265 [Micavibrio sp.]|nr:hypothetical protein [Micavibrio sp.]